MGAQHSTPHQLPPPLRNVGPAAGLLRVRGWGLLRGRETGEGLGLTKGPGDR